MAYRQLFAVTFVAFGLASSACGGGGASSTNGGSGTSSGQPPASDDQPPSNADRPPASSDRPAGSADKPPASADDSAGSGSSGRLGTLCRQLCDTVDQVVAECGMDDGEDEMDGLCSGETDCQIPSTPCDDEAAALLSCFIDVFSGICQSLTPGGDNEAPSLEDLCKSQLNATDACARANGIDDDVEDPGGGDNNQNDCTPAGNCVCADACAGCTCRAGTDTTKLQACVQAGGACAP